MGKLNILVLITKPFPLGFAGTNRLISFCTGLVELGDNIDVIIVKPTEKADNIKNSQVEGEYQGINFKYSYKNTIWPDNFFQKIFIAINSIIRSFIIFFQKNSNVKYDVIICYHNSLIINFGFFLLTFFTKTKLIYKVTEFPQYMWFDNNPNFLHKFMSNLMSKFFDGIIVMTYPLFDFYKKISRKNCEIFLMPMTVELERFNNVKKNSTHGEYLAYIGTLDHNKDGVYDLLKALALIINNHPSLFLLIIGGAKDNKELTRLDELVNDLDLYKNVKFIGVVDRYEVPSYLCNAKILVLARPDSIRAQGGFPTKLGEYLATGRPTVVTSVGDIPRYLRDGENSFIVQPGFPDLFAKKIEYILSNYYNASQVGLKGKKLANHVFSHKVQSEKMHDYLLKLVN